MASCSDLNRTEYRPITKATPIPLSTSKKLVEPFNRLKNRANLFRRKNSTSQLNINIHSTDHHHHPQQISFTSDQLVPSYRTGTKKPRNNSDIILLKRSNSMICPQQYFQTFLNQNNNNNNNNNRNSICFELSGCSIDESSTDDYQLNHYWTKPMSQIEENEHSILPIIEESNNNQEENDEKVSTSSLPKNNNNSEQASVIVPSSKSTMDIILREKEKEKEKDDEEENFSSASSTNPTSIISSSHSSSSTVILRDHAEAIRTRRQCHSSISLLQRQHYNQTLEETFYLPKKKSNLNMDLSTTTKISTCTMTGKSLNNLDECLSTTSSEDKGVQTTLNENLTINSCVKRAISSTSLSSSSASIQTDTYEKKPKIPIVTTTDETTSTNNINPPTTHLTVQHQTDSLYKWPHTHERLLGEQSCIYWVNYLGSTAIKMLNDGTTTMPTQAIARLKQSTQYARVLPIIGLSISSRGVEFLKHTKDRIVICYHDIKSIHCACQDQDLRYFAYATREQRLTNGMSHSNHDNKQQPPPSPSLSVTGDYHHYCHVFVVKSEAMSTEIMLTFGQAFDIAYRLHRRLKSNGKKSKDIHTPLTTVTNTTANNNNERHPQLEVIRLSTKSDITNNLIMSSSTHSPATSSSSSSMDDRKIFV